MKSTIFLLALVCAISGVTSQLTTCDPFNECYDRMNEGMRGSLGTICTAFQNFIQCTQSAVESCGIGGNAMVESILKMAQDRFNQVCAGREIQGSETTTPFITSTTTVAPASPGSCSALEQCQKNMYSSINQARGDLSKTCSALSLYITCGQSAAASCGVLQDPLVSSMLDQVREQFTTNCGNEEPVERTSSSVTTPSPKVATGDVASCVKIQTCTQTMMHGMNAGNLGVREICGILGEYLSCGRAAVVECNLRKETVEAALQQAEDQYKGHCSAYAVSVTTATVISTQKSVDVTTTVDQTGMGGICPQLQTCQNTMTAGIQEAALDPRVMCELLRQYLTCAEDSLAACGLNDIQSVDQVMALARKQYHDTCGQYSSIETQPPSVTARVSPRSKSVGSTGSPGGRCAGFDRCQKQFTEMAAGSLEDNDKLCSVLMDFRSCVSTETSECGYGPMLTSAIDYIDKQLEAKCGVVVTKSEEKTPQSTVSHTDSPSSAAPVEYTALEKERPTTASLSDSEDNESQQERLRSRAPSTQTTLASVLGLALLVFIL